MEIIPKSFASTIDDLQFSVTPARVLEADPVVAWEIDGKKGTDIRITSAKVSALGEGFVQAENTLVEIGASRCAGLKTDDMIFWCILSLAYQYRNNQMLRDEFSECTINDRDLCGTALAVMDRGLGDACYVVRPFRDGEPGLWRNTSSQEWVNYCIMGTLMSAEGTFDPAVCEAVQPYEGQEFEDPFAEESVIVAPKYRLSAAWSAPRQGSPVSCIA